MILLLSTQGRARSLEVLEKDAVTLGQFLVLTGEGAHELSIEEVNKLPLSNFKHAEAFSWLGLRERLGKGTWCLLRVRNNSQQALTRSLSLTFPFFQFQIYIKSPDGATSVKALPHQSELGQMPMFDVSLPPGETIIYAQIAGPAKPVLSMQFTSLTETKRLYRLNYYIKLAYGGIFFGIFVYNLFLLISIRNTAFIYYLVYIIGISCHGWPLSMVPVADYSEIHGFSIAVPLLWSIGLILAAASSILFAMKLLDLKKHAPKLVRLGYVTIGLVGVILGLMIINNSVYTPLSPLAFGLWGTYMALAMINGIRRRYRPAYYYAIAWVPLITLIPAIHLTSMFTAEGISTASAIIIGSAAVFEVLMFSLALGELVNIDRRKAQEYEYSLEVAETVQEALMQ